MSGKWSTGDYPEEARRRLGDIHRKARFAAGHPHRTTYADAVGVSMSSIRELEKGRPVGEYIATKLGRVLPGWTSDTARQILEGADAPARDKSDDLALSPLFTSTPDELEFWVAAMKELPMVEVQSLWARYQRSRGRQPAAEAGVPERD